MHQGVGADVLRVLGQFDSGHEAGVAGVGQQRYATGDGLDGHFVNLLALFDREGQPFSTGTVAGNGVDAHFDLAIDPGLGAFVVDAVILVERLDDSAVDAGQILARPCLGFVFLVFHCASP